MMKHFIVKLLTVAVFTALWTACGYIEGGKHVSEAPDTAATAIDSLALPNDSLAPNSAVDSTAAATDTLPQIIISGDSVPYVHSSSFIVVSKKDLRLIVYARSNRGDTIALASYPVCMGKNKGNKQGKGDMRTPESPAGKPFTITMIQDASTWKHDFGDGRGNILSYGHWFLRLDTPGHNGIGIHGSTNNENTVPGRASEGCIRLLDKDIITLKERYARVGMPVIVKAEEQGLLPFEQKCLSSRPRPIDKKD